MPRLRKNVDRLTFRSWCSMIDRCSRWTKNPRNIRYYVANGVTVDARWRGPGGYERFLADMGPRPTGTTLDRIDGAKGYEPGNCRWASNAIQLRNRRHVRLTLDLAQEILGRTEHGEGTTSIAKRLGVGQSTVDHVRAGNTWRELPRPVRGYQPQGPRRR